MDKDRRLTTGDVMKYCHVSRSTVLKWVKVGSLKAYLHPGGQYRITQSALIDFLKAHDMPIDEELLKRQQRRKLDSGV
jgi:excisionase family DNA binding protein